MDNLPRGRRFVLVAALIGAPALGCGAQDVGPVGVSPPRAMDHAQAGDDGGSAGADPLARLTRLTDRFLSQGHAQRFDAVVWANEAARQGPAESLTDGGAEYPEGAVFIEEAIERTRADAGTAGLLSMEKRAGAWRFTIVQPDGEVVGDPQTAACAACHRDAPRDGVFRTVGWSAARPGANAASAQSSSAAASAPMTATAPTPVATPAATYDARSAGSAAAPSKR